MPETLSCCGQRNCTFWLYRPSPFPRNNLALKATPNPVRQSHPPTPGGSFIPLSDVTIELLGHPEAGTAERAHVHVNRYAVDRVTAPIMLGHYFPGYSVTVAGGFIGFAYACACGFAVGYAVAWVYNRLIRLRVP